jgi:translation initiation factor IF-2
MPVRVTGLSEAPNAGDKFQVVPDISLAREVAERRREKQRLAQEFRPATFRLEDLGRKKVEELKIILKADVRGSVEAIKKQLEKLSHDEVRLKLLHTGIGAITEGDVMLASASPEDTLIVGFNVVPDDRARSLAEEKGIQIRQYDIIYNLTDDLRNALQGRLKPKEEVQHLGRAVVRKIFKISKVGTIAGCYVTQGVIERNARVRVIRDGVIIYPPPDKVAALESLKRFKDDVREVREGYDCGLKIAGYDDVKEGDVIEAFRVVEIQRTL